MATEKTKTATKKTTAKATEEKAKTKSAAAKKPAAKSTSKSEQKPAAKPAEKAQSPKPAASKELDFSALLAEQDKKIEALSMALEKVQGELNIIKQFKSGAGEKNTTEKIFTELEKVREQLFNCEDRLDELEYQVSEKEDY